jgi:hypothetical protein
MKHTLNHSEVESVDCPLNASQQASTYVCAYTILLFSYDPTLDHMVA